MTYGVKEPPADMQGCLQNFGYIQICMNIEETFRSAKDGVHDMEQGEDPDEPRTQKGMVGLQSEGSAPGQGGTELTREQQSEGQEGKPAPGWIRLSG